MQVAKCMNELADLKVCDMRDDVRHQRIAADIERHTEKRVGRALVKLAVQRPPVLDLELEQRVTRRQCDLITNSRVPTRNDQSSRIRICLDLPDQPSDLVDAVQLRV